VKRNIFVPLAAAIYGAVLSYLGFLATAGGHGPYLFLGLATSPLCLGFLLPLRMLSGSFGQLVFLAPLWCAPLWWALVASLASRIIRSKRPVVIVLLLLHYFGALTVLLVIDRDHYQPFGPIIRAFKSDPIPFMGILLFYLAGQWFLWREVRRPWSAAPVSATLTS
jgi:hypothetical protein